MIKLLILLLFVNAVISFPQNLGNIIKGPGSSVTIQGPDGSVIKAEAIGGVISIGDSAPAGALVPTVLIAPSEVPAPAEGAATTSAPSSTASPEQSSETNSEPNSEPADSGADTTGETTEAPEITTASKSDAETPTAKPASDVEILAPITLPPSEGEALELIGPSGRILVSGSGVVVAGPESTLVRENHPLTKDQTPLKQTEKLELSLIPQLQQRLVPGYYPSWSNLVGPLVFDL